MGSDAPALTLKGSGVQLGASPSVSQPVSSGPAGWRSVRKQAALPLILQSSSGLRSAKRQDGILQSLRAGVPEGCSRGIETVILAGQCGDALAITVRLAGCPGKSYGSLDKDAKRLGIYADWDGRTTVFVAALITETS